MTTGREDLALGRRNGAVATNARQPAAKGRPARRARGSLSPDEILDGACHLVAQDGLPALSMPILARHLHAGVTSIYWYFRSKDELLTALAERVTSDVYTRLPPIGSGAWYKEAERYFTAFRDELRRDPVYLELLAHRPRTMLSMPSVAAIVTRRLEDELSLFAKLGLTIEQAARLYNACATYTRGYVILEHGQQVETSATDPKVRADLRKTFGRLDHAEYPVLTEISDAGAFMLLSDEHFQFGLRVLIEGIRTSLASSGRATKAR
jgi:AcrR family transcriptional regulator